MIGNPGQVFPYRSVLAVFAHPDDESFGLGAILSTFAGLGIETQGLCFTHGEASTLGASGIELTVVRAAELTAAAAVLGVSSLRLLSYPDGALSEAPLEELCREVEASAAPVPIDCLLVFDEGGITRHPDHQRASEAALAAGDRLGVQVLAWCLPSSIAATLNGEFSTSFTGREPSEIDLEIEVDRTLQHEAISCHASQSTDNPVLWRRLTLQGNTESLRWLSALRGGSTGSV
jgi:LmbE family N-acetylglucosaminyl deacetylase